MEQISVAFHAFCMYRVPPLCYSIRYDYRLLIFLQVSSKESSYATSQCVHINIWFIINTWPQNVFRDDGDAISWHHMKQRISLCMMHPSVGATNIIKLFEKIWWTEIVKRINVRKRNEMPESKNMHTYDKSYLGPKCVSSSFFSLSLPLSQREYIYSMQFSIPQYCIIFHVGQSVHTYSHEFCCHFKAAIFYTKTQHAISFQFSRSSTRTVYFILFLFSFFFCSMPFFLGFLSINLLFSVCV